MEQVIQEIMRHLRFICNEKQMQTEWDIYLPLVLRILNAEPVATIGLSPAEILLPGIDLEAGFFPTSERAAKASVNAIPDPARRKAIHKWLTHLQEELLDGAVYIERLKVLLGALDEKQA